METKNKTKIGDTYDKFKSYYVVWKLKWNVRKQKKKTV